MTYMAMSSVMSGLFFPSLNKIASLIAVYSVFAIGFVVRPIGSLIMGWIGDMYGRRKALYTSIMCMVIPTFLLACCRHIEILV